MAAVPVKPATRSATATKRTSSRALDSADGTNNNNNGVRNVINSKYVKRRCQHGQQSQQRQQQQPPASSSQMSQLMDEVLESVATQGQNNDTENDEIDEDGDAGFSSREIRRLRKCVTELQQKVDFLMSIIGIDRDKQTDSTTINPSQTPSHKPSYAAVTKLNGPVRNAVLTAVYSDLQAKENMKRNVVIYGLQPDDDIDYGQTDIELVKQLCDEEFHDVPVIERVKRLGRVVENRIQPLLVVLREEGDAQNLLSIAKRLRQSGDEYTRDNVYISAHQTRAERQAAFESRCRRRQRVAERLMNETETDETSEPRHHRSSRGIGAPTNSSDIHSQQPPSQSNGANSSSKVVPPTGLTQPVRENETTVQSNAAAAVQSRPTPVVAAAITDQGKPVVTAADERLINDSKNQSGSLRPMASEFRPTKATAPTATAAAAGATGGGAGGSSDGGTY